MSSFWNRSHKILRNGPYPCIRVPSKGVTDGLSKVEDQPSGRAASGCPARRGRHPRTHTRRPGEPRPRAQESGAVSRAREIGGTFYFARPRRRPGSSRARAARPAWASAQGRRRRSVPVLTSRDIFAVPPHPTARARHRRYASSTRQLSRWSTRRCSRARAPPTSSWGRSAPPRGVTITASARGCGPPSPFVVDERRAVPRKRRPRLGPAFNSFVMNLSHRS